MSLSPAVVDAIAADEQIGIIDSAVDYFAFDFLADIRRNVVGVDISPCVALAAHVTLDLAAADECFSGVAHNVCLDDVSLIADERTIPESGISANEM